MKREEKEKILEDYESSDELKELDNLEDLLETEDLKKLE